MQAVLTTGSEGGAQNLQRVGLGTRALRHDLGSLHRQQAESASLLAVAFSHVVHCQNPAGSPN